MEVVKLFVLVSFFLQPENLPFEQGRVDFLHPLYVLTLSCVCENCMNFDPVSILFFFSVLYQRCLYLLVVICVAIVFIFSSFIIYFSCKCCCAVISAEGR